MSTPTTTVPTAGVRKRNPLADGWTIVYRNLLVLRRNPLIILSGLAGPLGMLMLFGYVFAEAMSYGGSGEQYRQALIPAVFVLVAATSLILSAGSTALDLTNGVTERLRSMPIRRFAVPFGLVGSQFILLTISLATMAVIALLIGWRPTANVLSVIAGFALILVFGYALSWVGVVIGLAIRDSEVIQQFSALIFALVMFSNAFVPIDSMPGIFRTFAEWSPVSAANTGARVLFGEDVASSGPWPLTHPVLATVVWTVVLIAAFAPLAARRYSKPD